MRVLHLSCRVSTPFPRPPGGKYPLPMEEGKISEKHCSEAEAQTVSRGSTSQHWPCCVQGSAGEVCPSTGVVACGECSAVRAVSAIAASDPGPSHCCHPCRSWGPPSQLKCAAPRQPCVPTRFGAHLATSARHRSLPLGPLAASRSSAGAGPHPSVVHPAHLGSGPDAALSEGMRRRVIYNLSVPINFRSGRGHTDAAGMYG